jgi:hypothetical protein
MVFDSDYATLAKTGDHTEAASCCKFYLAELCLAYQSHSGNEKLQGSVVLYSKA